MTSITEGMRNRERIVKYAIKHQNNAKAGRRYHCSRQYVAYWRNKYDGTIESLRKTSTRPKGHPNQHTKEELKMIKHMHRHHSYRGLAHVYRKCVDNDYTRSYDSMCRQIRRMNMKPQPQKKKKWKRQKPHPTVTYPGEKVQVDVKYVPFECIGFASHHARYYQITAIDVYSRKRVLQLVNENSTYTTSEFIKTLPERMGFPIKVIQTDNGREFCNDPNTTDKRSRFQTFLDTMGIKHVTTAPYSPWQNGHVERSHREDDIRFYQRHRFDSEEAMCRSFKRYETTSNNTYRKILNFKNPQEIINQYFKACA